MFLLRYLIKWHHLQQLQGMGILPTRPLESSPEGPCFRMTKCWSPKCTHMDTDTAEHTATDKALHIQDSRQTQAQTGIMSLPFLGWQQQKVAGAATHHTIQVHKHTHICRSPEYGPFACLALLSAYWSSSVSNFWSLTLSSSSARFVSLCSCFPLYLLSPFLLKRSLI